MTLAQFSGAIAQLSGLLFVVRPGVAALFKQALGNHTRLIGGTEYAMTVVSRF